MVVGVEALEVAQIGGVADPHRLDHLGARALSDRRTERRALVAVQLDVREAEDVDAVGDLVDRLVDEHAHGLDLAPRPAG